MENVKLPAEFPYEIRNVEEAEAIGKAMEAVHHFTPVWAPSVFMGDPSFNRNTGPAVLNQELQDMWHDWSADEKRRVMAIYTAERIGR